MIGEGSIELDGAAEHIYHALLDPELLQRTIPGCRGFEDQGERRYTALMEAGVGPIKGAFKAKFSVTDVRPSEGYTLQVEGQGTPGSVFGRVTVSLASSAPQRTQLHYAYDVSVSGKIAMVGQRMLDAAAKMVAAQFFKRLHEELAAR
ncbi:carbon monoxide dehydrogenase [bacterium]|nr:MAG: carbon monoxide dehydrogenase [bacterium]